MYERVELSNSSHTCASPSHFKTKLKKGAGYAHCYGMAGGTVRVVLVVIEKTYETSCLSIDRPERTKQDCYSAKQRYGRWQIPFCL